MRVAGGYLWKVQPAACGDGLRRRRAAWGLEERGKGQAEAGQEQHGDGVAGRAKRLETLLLHPLCKTEAKASVTFALEGSIYRGLLLCPPVSS